MHGVLVAVTVSRKGCGAGGVLAWCCWGLAQALSSLGTRCQKRLVLVLPEAWWRSRSPSSCHRPQGLQETAACSTGCGDPPVRGLAFGAVLRRCISQLFEDASGESVVLDEQNVSLGLEQAFTASSLCLSSCLLYDSGRREVLITLGNRG